MIKTKEDLKLFMDMDKKALGITRKSPKIIGDYIWKWERLLRKCEYLKNNNKKIYYLYKLKFNKKSLKLGFSIPLNVCDYGLSIAHYGTIVINSNTKIGKNCRIHEGVTIGATNGKMESPIIGDNVFIGTGAKIIGNVKIGDNTAIGAGSVVVNSFEKGNFTLGGIPAKVISNNSSKSNLII